MVRSIVEKKGVVSNSIRYYLSSLSDINIFADAVRKHWSIGNQLHWCLYVVFGEDSSKSRKDNSDCGVNQFLQ